jgi:hypothetical protein
MGHRGPRPRGDPDRHRRLKGPAAGPGAQRADGASLRRQDGLDIPYIADDLRDLPPRRRSGRPGVVGGKDEVQPRPTRPQQPPPDQQAAVSPYRRASWLRRREPTQRFTAGLTNWEVATPSDGMICIRPTAPAAETTARWPPLSCAITARIRAAGTAGVATRRTRGSQRATAASTRCRKPEAGATDSGGGGGTVSRAEGTRPKGVAAGGAAV